MLSNINIHNIKQNASNKFRLYSLLSQNKPLVIVPKCISAINIDNRTVLVEFDIPVKSVDFGVLPSAFSVHAQEYDMIPGGSLSTKEYTDVSIQYYAQRHINAADLPNAALVDTSLINGSIMLGEE